VLVCAVNFAKFRLERTKKIFPFVCLPQISRKIFSEKTVA
jgi:hypothetical protein